MRSWPCSRRTAHSTPAAGTPARQQRPCPGQWPAVTMTVRQVRRSAGSDRRRGHGSADPEFPGQVPGRAGHACPGTRRDGRDGPGDNGHFSETAGQRRARPPSHGRPQQDSNLRTRLRRPMLYPLSYGGCATWERVPVSNRYRDTQRVHCAITRQDATLTRVEQGLRRVLVVDDDEVIRQLIAVNLQLEGFDVSMAVDGQDCLDKVGDIDPDVITLDVMMPRLDGWETAVQLRSSPDTAHIKVVLISARAQEDDKARGSRVGADAYLTKPFDPNEMIRVVRELAGAS